MPVIVTESLTKSYKLYHKKNERIWEQIHPLRKKYHKKFLALDAVNLTIEKGEIIGIIGRNGSGKSTLLKILASVITPSSGSFTCNGKVTALLELGGGFNQELTGRQNIYFLGAIQGYSTREMKERINKIIEFADIGDYIDQPVKNYSSGMYVRLAFSMTINIDPEILITDEALAVGDLRFQQKCYRRIRELKDEGKTILLCTHGLGTVREFCTRAVWIEKGKIMEQGDPILVTQNYSAFMASQGLAMPMSKMPLQAAAASIPIPAINDVEWENLSSCESYGMGGATFTQSAILNIETGKRPEFLTGGEKVRLLLRVRMKNHIINPGIQIVLNAQFGNPVFKISSNAYKQQLKLSEETTNVVAVDFDFPHIGNGKYTFSFGILPLSKEGNIYNHWVHDGLIVDVINPDIRYKMGAQLILEEVRVKVVTSDFSCA
jgi:ABC-type polysaccharide/polyol phosphate transport system ATPase subunit